MSWPPGPDMPDEDPGPIPGETPPPEPDPGTPEPQMWAVHRQMLTDALNAADTDWPVLGRDTAAVEELIRLDTGTVGTVVTWLRRRVHASPPDET